MGRTGGRLSAHFHKPGLTLQRGHLDGIRALSSGGVVGLVGESGCGKSTVAFAMMGYLPCAAQIGETIRFEHASISKMSQPELRILRGNRVATVYQDAGIRFMRHNLGVIARVADRVAVMHAGEIVEQAANLGRRGFAILDVIIREENNLPLQPG